MVYEALKITSWVLTVGEYLAHVHIKNAAGSRRKFLSRDHSMASDWALQKGYADIAKLLKN
jgi:hypothetical protein